MKYRSLLIITEDLDPEIEIRNRLEIERTTFWIDDIGSSKYHRKTSNEQTALEM